MDYPVSGDEIGVLKTSCVYSRVFRSDENKVVVREELARVKCPVKKGTIIISRMNTPDLVGASAYIPFDFPNLFLPDRLWAASFVSKHFVCPEYIQYSTLLKGFRNQISCAAEGTSSSMQNISKEDYLSIPVALPTLQEQIEITRFLNTRTQQIDRLIERAEASIALTRERRTALISAAVTGKIDVREWRAKEGGISYPESAPEFAMAAEPEAEWDDE